MIKNMGQTDRIIRVVLAILFVGLFYFEVVTGTLGVVLFILAGIFVLTSMVSFCPLYAPFKLKTIKDKKA